MKGAKKSSLIYIAAPKKLTKCLKNTCERVSSFLVTFQAVDGGPEVLLKINTHGYFSTNYILEFIRKYLFVKTHIIYKPALHCKSVDWFLYSTSVYLNVFPNRY